MTRTIAREIAVQLSFSIAAQSGDQNQYLDDFFDREYFATLAKEDPLFAEYPGKKERDYIRALCTGVVEKQAELDGYIEKYARGWKLNRISRVALAVLRCCLYELRYMPEIPPAASINEAVELAKGYEEPETVSFINGILGSYMRGEQGEASPAPEAAVLEAEAAEPAAPETGA